MVEKEMALAATEQLVALLNLVGDVLVACARWLVRWNDALCALPASCQTCRWAAYAGVWNLHQPTGIHLRCMVGGSRSHWQRIGIIGDWEDWARNAEPRLQGPALQSCRGWKATQGNSFLGAKKKTTQLNTIFQGGRRKASGNYCMYHIHFLAGGGMRMFTVFCIEPYGEKCSRGPNLCYLFTVLNRREKNASEVQCFLIFKTVHNGQSSGTIRVMWKFGSLKRSHFGLHIFLC